MQEFDPHVLEEKPIPPPEEFSKRAHVGPWKNTGRCTSRRERDPEAFWGEQAEAAGLVRDADEDLEWDLPHAKWFVGGKLNVAYNCLDRHLEKKRQQARAVLGSRRRRNAAIHLCRTARARLPVCECAAVAGSESRGLRGDLLPMIPELPIAMLACARIGAVHSVVFGGFSATALADRIADCKVETADHRRRRISPREDRSAQGNRGCSAEKLPDD